MKKVLNKVKIFLILRKVYLGTCKIICLTSQGFKFNIRKSISTFTDGKGKIVHPFQYMQKNAI